MPVLGHVLKHMPRHVLRHVLGRPWCVTQPTNCPVSLASCNQRYTHCHGVTKPSQCVHSDMLLLFMAVLLLLIKMFLGVGFVTR